MEESLKGIAKLIGAYYLLAGKVEAIEIVQARDVYAFYRMNDGKRVLQVQFDPRFARPERFRVKAQLLDYDKLMRARRYSPVIGHEREVLISEFPNFQNGLDIRVDDPESILISHLAAQPSHMIHERAIEIGAIRLRDQLEIAMPELKTKSDGLETFHLRNLANVASAYHGVLR